MNYSIPNKDYISFDIFDTLICRDVIKPSDLFYYIERYCANQGLSCPQNFAHNRINAERDASKKYHGFATYGDIYNCLKIRVNSDISTVYNLELSFEKNFCKPIGKMVDFYNQCIKAGKKVYLISDMYLPSHFISDLLEGCGIKGYSDLFVSCEEKAKKSDGSLFNKVLSRLGISAHQLIHIGDNIRSDYLVPVKLGMSARFVNNKKKTNPLENEILLESQLIDYHTLSACVRNCVPNFSKYERWGCESFGPLLYGFTQWLKEQCKKDQINDVFFMSRDGYMMKKAFDLCNDIQVGSHYMYCSRKAFTTPLLWRCNKFEDLFKYIVFSKNMTLRRMLLRLGLKPEKYVEVAKKYKLDLDYCYYNHAIETNKVVISFYEEIKTDLFELSKQEYEAISKYLNDLQIKGNIAVVDIGYHGTMQNGLINLFEEFNIKANVVGYYIGLNSTKSYVDNDRIRARAYLYDNTHGKELEKRAGYLTPMLESVFLAQHGSVSGFQFISGRVSPIMDIYEYESKDGQIFDEKNFIIDYQHGALRLVEYLYKSYLKDCLVVEPETAFVNFARVGFIPTLDEAVTWGNMRFFDYTTMYIAKPERNIFKGCIKSVWKIGYMKRLFKIPIRYDKLCSTVRNWYHCLFR